MNFHGGGWVGGWLGIAKIKPIQPQLGLAGAWAELGNRVLLFLRICCVTTSLSNFGKKLSHLNF